MGIGDFLKIKARWINCTKPPIHWYLLRVFTFR